MYLGWMRAVCSVSVEETILFQRADFHLIDSSLTIKRAADDQPQ